MPRLSNGPEQLRCMREIQLEEWKRKNQNQDADELDLDKGINYTVRWPINKPSRSYTIDTLDLHHCKRRRQPGRLLGVAGQTSDSELKSAGEGDDIEGNKE